MLYDVKKNLAGKTTTSRGADPISRKQADVATAQRGLGDLPPELFSDIFQRLGGPAEVAKLRLVCKAWKTMAEDDAIWRAFEQPVAKVPADAAAHLQYILERNVDRCGPMTVVACRRAVDAQKAMLDVELQQHLSLMFSERLALSLEATPNLRSALGDLGPCLKAVSGALVGSDYEGIRNWVRCRPSCVGARLTQATTKYLDALRVGLKAGLAGAGIRLPVNYAEWLQPSVPFAERMRLLHRKNRSLALLEDALARAVEAADTRMIRILVEELNTPLSGCEAF